MDIQRVKEFIQDKGWILFHMGENASVWLHVLTGSRGKKLAKLSCGQAMEGRECLTEDFIV